MKDTSQQGLISHTAVLNRLVQLGFEVLLPGPIILDMILHTILLRNTEVLDFSFTKKRILFVFRSKQGVLRRVETALNLILSLSQLTEEG